MNYSLGVDIGTTFVAAAVASATRAEMFTLGDRTVVTPTAVYLREDGVLVTGEAAARRTVSRPDRVSREFKRRLGSPTPVVLGDQPYSVTELLGAVLRDVVQKVIHAKGKLPERVLLTYPASWGPFRRALFEEVPERAGLTNAFFATEHEAAAGHYAASRSLSDGQIVAVYDLGGGTFDATILRKQPGGMEILGTPEGIERLGGVDFDESILSHVDYAADGALSKLDLSDPQISVALARLRQDCVTAKEALSVNTETVIPVFLPGRHFDVRITRAQFEDFICTSIESTIGTLSRTLASARVEPAQLSAVLLIGKSSGIPLVARMISAELRQHTVALEPHAVALGAAMLAANPSMSKGVTEFATYGEPSIPAENRTKHDGSMEATESTTGGIFISYRRQDEPGFAGRLYDRLVARFGADAIFIDVDSIDLGLDFTEVINQSLLQCKVLLAIIGKNWLSAVDNQGRSRLDNPNDYVRLEIETALRREIRVIPILVETASMPKGTELPPSMEALSKRNGAYISHTRFKVEVDHFVNTLVRILKVQ